MSSAKRILILICFFGTSHLRFVAQNEMISLRTNIYDEKNELTAARVRFTDLSGNYFAPDGIDANFAVTNTTVPHSQEEGLVLDNERKFAYSNGDFTISLPLEKIIIEIVKGFRYQIYHDTIDLLQEISEIKIQLNPLYQYPENNWYSGDVHVHYIDPETAMLQMQSEDLEVCNLLISDFTVDHNRFRGDIEPISGADHLIYYGQEFREDRLGHINLLNIKSKLIEPAASPRRYQYPLNIQASDSVHRDGGHVSWAHFAAWPGLEGPLGLVLKKVDAVELLCTIDPFQEPIFAADVVPALPVNSGLDLYYRLLNCGLQIPVTAGTDKMNNQVSVGANRVYALIDNSFNYSNWVSALNGGKTFISNNPFLLLKVDGRDPGAVINSSGEAFKITAEVWSQFPLDRLEIIANGVLIAEKHIAPGEIFAKLEIDYQPDKSCWIAARAYQFSHPFTRQGLSLTERRNENNGNTLLNKYYGTLRPETTFAHTSPVYVIQDNNPVRIKEDALYFVRYLENARQWLDESGSFPDSNSKEFVLKAFREGIETFHILAKEDSK